MSHNALPLTVEAAFLLFVYHRGMSSITTKTQQFPLSTDTTLALVRFNSAHVN